MTAQPDDSRDVRFCVHAKEIEGGGVEVTVSAFAIVDTSVLDSSGVRTSWWTDTTSVWPPLSAEVHFRVDLSDPPTFALILRAFLVSDDARTFARELQRVQTP